MKIKMIFYIYRKHLSYVTFQRIVEIRSHITVVA